MSEQLSSVGLSTFLSTIEGAQGAVVFGIPAVKGYVERVGDDYLILETKDGTSYAIPTSGIAYFRYGEE